MIKSLSKARQRRARTAFLCHSHLDADLAEGLVTLLNEAEWTVYVDWNDAAMPDSPNQQTAKRIKEKIVDLDYFLFLATQNSTSSRWCPWEIGYADGRKDNDQILIVPIAEGSKIHGSEYLELYRSVDVLATGQMGVWRPHNQTGVLIKSL